MRGKKQVIPVNKIVTKINVRNRLRQERVTYLTNVLRMGGTFAELIEVRYNAEKKVWELILGRHRLAAVEAMGFEEWECFVVKCSLKKATHRAVSENAGNTHLPYDDSEIPLNINTLLDAGWYKPEIRRIFKDIPEALMTKYFSRASSLKYKIKVRKAVAACQENAKVDRQLIATRFGIRLSSLEKALQGNGKPPGLPEIKGTVTREFGKLQNKMTNTSARLRKCFQEGQITEVQLIDISNHVQDRLKSMTLALKEEHGRNERLSSVK